ncbi:MULTISPECIES: hypothetical protein [Methylobacteriaceae]|uniref:hypothetical protein n=1 Tax=Methylobacteriaceae TaxID=119045 RepID=UPI000D487343|nr:MULTISPECIES: hypothetical protein [Methylobacteriaceae]MCP1549460.1 ABC-type nitrate/sulfonate/bicarbonate transport system substrate-binding protein [Methylorubrum zatmanii]MCP1553927.1 ABC-type nitrate/sulfonate/bicarbonate transport system substrate-binding protein [Methylorubrum extorquens]MCP1579762.1 ABC-type nitrate/sulfonate/bicarbonate transport system substrate-binding protein [Methylorubrum extorquens]POR40985.1 hypothetical protein CRT23_21065 [Methylobacterium sp. V23]
MRSAIILILLATPAAAAPEYPVQHTTAEYLAAYGKARAYAQAHSPLKARPICRKAIGRRSSMVVEQRCRDVAAGTRTNCTTRDWCVAMLDNLARHCHFWRGDVPCVHPEDGGSIRNPPPTPRP